MINVFKRKYVTYIHYYFALNYNLSIPYNNFNNVKQSGTMMSRLATILIIAILLLACTGYTSHIGNNEIQHAYRQYFMDKISGKSFYWSSLFSNASHACFIHSMYNISHLSPGEVVVLGRFSGTVLLAKYFPLPWIFDADRYLVFSEKFIAIPGPNVVAVIDIRDGNTFPIMATDWKKYSINSTIGGKKLPYVVWKDIEYPLHPVYIAVVDDILYSVFDSPYARALFLSVNLTRLSDFVRELLKSYEEPEINFNETIAEKLKECMIASFYSIEGVLSYPAFHDGRMFIPLDNGSISCFDMLENRTIWCRNLGELALSGVSLYGERLFLVTTCGRAYSLNIENGETIWRSEIGVHSITCPLACSNRIYVGDFRGHIYCLNPSTGDVIYVSRRLNGTIINLAWHHCGIIAATDNFTVYCLNSSDGKIKWSIHDERINGFIESTDYIINLGRLLVNPWTGGTYELPYHWREVFIDDDYFYAIQENGAIAVYSTPGRFRVHVLDKNVSLEVGESIEIPIIFDVKKGLEVDNIEIITVCDNSCISYSLDKNLVNSDTVIWLSIKAKCKGATHILLIFASGTTMEAKYFFIGIIVHGKLTNYSAQKCENIISYLAAMVLLIVILITLTIVSVIRKRIKHNLVSFL